MRMRERVGETVMRLAELLSPQARYAHYEGQSLEPRLYGERRRAEVREGEAGAEGMVPLLAGPGPS